MNNCKCANKCGCEYPCKVPAGIREVMPTCKDKAVIPILTIESVESMRGMTDCFIHVNANNTTYYIDDKGRTAIIWAGPVEAPGYDYQNNPLNLRSQSVYDFANNIEIYYNAVGAYRIKTLSTEV